MKPETLTDTELTEIHAALRLYLEFEDGAAELIAKIKSLNEFAVHAMVIFDAMGLREVRGE